MFKANINIQIDDEGLKLNVKDFNINRFCIDNVFKKLEKRERKKLKNSKSENLDVAATSNSDENSKYVIEIKV